MIVIGGGSRGYAAAFGLSNWEERQPSLNAPRGAAHVSIEAAGCILREAAITTDQAFEMTETPLSLLICDSGYIEIEMAFLMNAFGAKVILATESPRILPREDHDTSQRIAHPCIGPEIFAAIGNRFTPACSLLRVGG